MQITEKTNNFYKVKKDEDIFKICKRFKLDISTFKTINKIENVKENMYVLLPKSYRYSYVVKPLDTIKTIANKLGVTEEIVKQNVKTKALYIGQKIIF